MATKKGGLGRGLGSLFEDTGSGVDTGEDAQVSRLPLHDIEPDKDQPRKSFDADALSELAKSIEEHGVIQPIVVRPNPTGGYRIIAGERRWRAARQAGLRDVPVLVKDVSDSEAMELALIENLQREDLDPVEEALGYRRLMDVCGYTQEKAAEKVAKSRSAVANSLRILALPKDVLELLKSGVLTGGHAKAILSIPQAHMQSEAAALIVKEGMNVRRAEAVCKKMQKQPKGKSTAPLRPAIAAEVEIALREVLGTEVRVEYQEGRGSLSVGFYSDEQLSAFANLLGKYEQ